MGHGIVQMPPSFNHPARVAERIATLDLVSSGRVDWGTGERRKREELAPYLEAAMKRMQPMAPLTEETATTVQAWGRRIAIEPEQLQKNMDAILRRATGIGEPK